MKLSKSQRCPIHPRERWCVCRGENRERKSALSSKWVQIRPGISRIEDPHHPRGFRERRSRAELTKLTRKKVEEQGNLCVGCDEPFTDMSQVTTEHLDSRGMGGSWRDDHPSNIAASHSWCNSEKGSMSIEDFRTKKGLPELLVGANS